MMLLVKASFVSASLFYEQFDKQAKEKTFSPQG